MTVLAPNQMAAIPRLFSSSVVRELARKGKSPLFARLARQALLFDSLSVSRCVHDLFDFAFSLLQREGYRDEYVYRTALTQKILLGKHSLQTASMLNEFRVGECKADVAILNGTATVYEIKSERDSLVRLQKQIEAYATVFAKVYVVASESHIAAVQRLVPHEVGIYCLNRRYQISPVQDAVERPECTSALAIFDSIRTQEARLILQSNDVKIPDVPNTLLHGVLRDLFAKLPPVRAHAGMVEVLKKTRNLLPLSALITQLPTSLHSAALAMPLRKVDHSRLVTAVNTPLGDAAAWA